MVRRGRRFESVRLVNSPQMRIFVARVDMREHLLRIDDPESRAPATDDRSSGLAAPPCDGRDEEEQRRCGCRAEEPGGEAVSGGNSGRQEGHGRASEREQRSDEQAPHQDGGDSRSLDRRVRRRAAGQRNELAQDEDSGGEERNAPNGGVFSVEGRERTENGAGTKRRSCGAAPKSSPAHRAAAWTSTGAAIGSSGPHHASAIPAPASRVRTASRSSNQIRQAIGPAAASASARYGSGSTSTIETW